MYPRDVWKVKICLECKKGNLTVNLCTPLDLHINTYNIKVKLKTKHYWLSWLDTYIIEYNVEFIRFKN